MYRIFSRLERRDGGVQFLNYGYAPPRPVSPARLVEADEDDRPFIELYRRVVGQIDLGGRDVLEVSCGHGGGASYITRYMAPRRVVGLDLNPRGIQMCRETHSAKGLEFEVGDALDLPFVDTTFDAVVNIEASHCYPSIAAFLAEVGRLLRPGGHLLFADFRWLSAQQDDLRQEILDGPLDIVECEDLTAGVVAALDAYAGRRRVLVDESIPGPFVGLALRHFAVPGTSAFESFRSGEGTYLRYVLRKPS